ncbi:MAG TPA: glycosyltransferase [Flavisolibacter sp.]|nr:glycosyltransferase [Flavisolibacter sp.]
MRILVMGYIVRGPLGGMAWHHLQYVLGLKEMGHEVLFLEDSDDYPSCYNPENFNVTTDPVYGLAFLDGFLTRFELQDLWAYYDSHTSRFYGWSEKKVKEFCASADVAINLSGINPLREWWQNIPCRLLIDTDPVFTQIKHLTDAKQMSFAQAHTHFASFGENFGKKGCLIPEDGFNWLPTRQPVCLHAWKVAELQPQRKWTTVMQWDSYKTGEYKGEKFGMKSASFVEYISLPSLAAPDTFELALGSQSAPRNNLRALGWTIVDPVTKTKTPEDYQRYLAESKGEWTVAKQGYVISNSGWFSERTLNYMASGKPVVVQDTGFSAFLPIGEGLLPFTNIEEAVVQLKKANTDYATHAKAARKFVEEHFEAGAVLQALLSQI